MTTTDDNIQLSSAANFHTATTTPTTTNNTNITTNSNAQLTYLDIY